MKIIRKGNEDAAIVPRRVRDPFSEMFSRFFDDEFLPSGFFKPDWNPRVDIYEEASNFVVKADIPGADEKNLDVEVEGPYLTIKGSKEEEHEEKGKNFHKIERSGGSFSRTITLPEQILSEKISADYKKGVLTITIPKSTESTAKKISIKVS
jgi:HSP20 family protein